MASMPVRRVLIYGGRGALGSACVSHFKSNNWWVGSVDLRANTDANANAVIGAQANTWVEQETEVVDQVDKILNGDKVDALICVAGGWFGGSAASDEFIKNCDAVWKQSVWTSAIAVKLATKYLKEGGLLSLTGARAAIEGTPSMIGYGMAKAAVHHLVKSAAQPKSGVPRNTLTVAILPVTLDTPMNRKFMPQADFSSWTPLPYVAELLFKWANGIDRPLSGSLVHLITKQGMTKLEFS